MLSAGIEGSVVEEPPIVEAWVGSGVCEGDGKLGRVGGTYVGEDRAKC